MAETDERSQKRGQKREYVPPKLETLGTIRELTRGPGANNNFDGEHPPGQNKSRF
jgi:hypothetical protein